MAAIETSARIHRVAIVEDCCQAHLATSEGRPAGTIGAAGAFSFYPTKNLGALGDGGAMITNDGALADRVARLRNGGQTDRYHHQEPGINSRLDDLQAAVLRARLPRLRGWTDRRRALAARYRDRLARKRRRRAAQLDSGHVYHCSSSGTVRGLIFRRSSRRAGSRRWFTIPCRSRGNRRWPRSGRPSVRLLRARATRYSHCRSIPPCATTRSTRSPRPCTPSSRGRWPHDERT